MLRVLHVLFGRCLLWSQSMLLPILDEGSVGTRRGDAVIKTISSRIAGGRRELSSEPSRVCLSCKHRQPSQRIVPPRSLLTFENSARRCPPSCMRQNCLLSLPPSLLATTSSLLIFVSKERASLIWCRVSIVDDCELPTTGSVPRFRLIWWLLQLYSM
jgi:hypothetical protein